MGVYIAIIVYYSLPSSLKQILSHQKLKKQRFELKTSAALDYVLLQRASTMCHQDLPRIINNSMHTILYYVKLGTVHKGRPHKIDPLCPKKACTGSTLVRAVIP